MVVALVESDFDRNQNDLLGFERVFLERAQPVVILLPRLVSGLVVGNLHIDVLVHELRDVFREENGVEQFPSILLLVLTGALKAVQVFAVFLLEEVVLQVLYGFAFIAY